MAVKETVQFIHHQREEALMACGTAVCANVRTEKNVGQLQDFAVRRHRFRVEDIQTGDDIALLQPVDERCRVGHLAARNADEDGAGPQAGQLLFPQHSLGCGGVGNQADDHVAG